MPSQNLILIKNAATGGLEMENIPLFLRLLFRLKNVDFKNE